MSFDKDLDFRIILSYNRWFVYVLFAFFGGCINVQLFSRRIEAVVVLCMIFLAYWELTFDFTILLYATKTFIPDFFASKLDRKLWKLLLFLSIFGIGYANYIFKYNFFDFFGIWTILALAQLFSELGDNYLENITFFRHRFSFEFTNILIWFFILPTGNRHDEERRLFYFDLIASLSYRMTGFLLKLRDLDFRNIRSGNINSISSDKSISNKKE